MAGSVCLCTSYGLGSKLPWDESFLIESLSDSTIYPAYYTVAHYLHKYIYRRQPGLGGIIPQQMTDDVWDYVFAKTDAVGTDIQLDTLDAVRREFTYWYPLDLRVSGKDLIRNHLTFFLYIHVAMWPEEYWPRGIRPNGHLLNGEKMAKSTGNFLTLQETVAKFGADAARIAIADAGDLIEEANFEESVVNKTILKLYELKKCLEDMVLHPVLVDSEDAKSKGKTVETMQRTGEFNLWDKLFENELNELVEETRIKYDGFLFKAALRSGFYNFTSARDFYREATKASQCGMHRDLILRYTELQAPLLAPVASHWSEYIWLEVLRKPDTIHNAVFPRGDEIVVALSATLHYVRTTLSNVTSALAAQGKRLAKGKNTAFDPRQPFRLTVFCATAPQNWQNTCLRVLREEVARTGNCYSFEIQIVGKEVDKKDFKKAMSFVNDLRGRISQGGESSNVLDMKLPFNERAILMQMEAIMRQIMQKLEKFDVVWMREDGRNKMDGEELPTPAAGAAPGKPTFQFEN